MTPPRFVRYERFLCGLVLLAYPSVAPAKGGGKVRGGLSLVIAILVIVVLVVLILQIV
jgi:hypothetical protein